MQVADNESDTAQESADLGREASGIESERRGWAECDSEVVEDHYMVAVQGALTIDRFGEDDVDAQPLAGDRRDDPRPHPPKVHYLAAAL